MSVARTTEISATSAESFEAAINEGLERAKQKSPSKPSAAAASPARIIMADDHGLVRKAMSYLLESQPDLQIID